MKSITLLRHAKSSWDDPVERDFDRPLNPKGRHAAMAIGRYMAAEKLAWDLIVASPALRVIETLGGVEEGLGHALKVDLDRRIYMASGATLLDLVQEADDDAERLMLVGHNPGLEDFAFLLTPADDGAYRDAIDVKFPTATLCEIRVPVDRWDAVAEGAGTIARLVRPRDLDPALGPDT